MWAAASNGRVVLSWDENTEDDLAGYAVYRTAVSGGGYVRQNSLLDSSEFIDDNIVNGTLYHYVITAVDESFNESAATAEVSALPIDSNDVSVIIQELTPGFCGVEGTVDSDNAGFTGSGFANGDNAVGSGINWSVQITPAALIRLRGALCQRPVVGPAGQSACQRSLGCSGHFVWGDRRLDELE